MDDGAPEVDVAPIACMAVLLLLSMAVPMPAVALLMRMFPRLHILPSQLPGQTRPSHGCAHAGSDKQPPVLLLQAHWLSSLVTWKLPRSYDAISTPVSRMGTISAAEGAQFGLESRQQPAFAVDRRGEGLMTLPTASYSRMPVTSHVLSTEARAPKTSILSYLRMTSDVPSWPITTVMK